MLSHEFVLPNSSCRDQHQVSQSSPVRYTGSGPCSVGCGGHGAPFRRRRCVRGRLSAGHALTADAGESFYCNGTVLVGAPSVPLPRRALSPKLSIPPTKPTPLSVIVEWVIRMRE